VRHGTHTHLGIGTSLSVLQVNRNTWGAVTAAKRFSEQREPDHAPQAAFRPIFRSLVLAQSTCVLIVKCLALYPFQRKEGVSNLKSGSC